MHIFFAKEFSYTSLYHYAKTYKTKSNLFFKFFLKRLDFYSFRD